MSRKNRRKNYLESSVTLERALHRWWHGQTRYLSMALEDVQDTPLGALERYTGVINSMLINLRMLLLFRPISLLSYARTTAVKYTLAPNSTGRRLGSLKHAIADTNNAMISCVEHVLKFLSVLVVSTARGAADPELCWRRDQLIRKSGRMVQQCEEILRNTVLTSLWFSALNDDHSLGVHPYAFQNHCLTGQQELTSLQSALQNLIALTIRLHAAPSQYRQSLRALLDQLTYLENGLKSPSHSTNRRTSTMPAAPWLNPKTKLTPHATP